MRKAAYLFAVVVFGLSIASAKSYQIKIDNACKAGNVELKPGTYSVQLDASKVRFTDVDSRQTVEADAKVVTADKKYNQTLVSTKQVNGAMQISEIDLGGSKTRLEFQ